MGNLCTPLEESLYEIGRSFLEKATWQYKNFKSASSSAIALLDKYLRKVYTCPQKGRHKKMHCHTEIILKIINDLIVH